MASAPLVFLVLGVTACSAMILVAADLAARLIGFQPGRTSAVGTPASASPSWYSIDTVFSPRLMAVTMPS
jgi:hypothetical protein